LLHVFLRQARQRVPPRHALALLGLWAFAAAARAGPPVTAAKTALSAPRFAAGSARATVPFENEGGLIFVTVGVGPSRPLSFLLDTGFGDTILDAAVAQELRLAARDQRKAAEPGGALETATLPPVEMRLPGLVIPDVRMQTLPLGEISRFPGRRIDGILGHTVLSRFVLTVDYPDRRSSSRIPVASCPRAPARPCP
jgi:hypothetical protein